MKGIVCAVRNSKCLKMGHKVGAQPPTRASQKDINPEKLGQR